MTFPPTAEQQHALDLFATGEGLAIEAGAGSGKTTTLKMLATSTTRRGQYVAFNRAIVDDAKKTMPSNVKVSYADVFGRKRLLVLDDRHRVEFDTCIPGFDESKSKGSGPARNFIWDTAVKERAKWHWIMDDNIANFTRLHGNRRIPVGDGLMFRLMEEFVLRYRNVGMAGPDYRFFADARTQHKPFTLNTRVFSCNLIRNDVPLRWRARYNEDLDLSLRMLKGGWCTVLFKAFLQDKLRTQTMGGGNTEAFYADEGTKAKSELIVRLHPDACRLAMRYGRAHHHVDFRPWKSRALVLRDDARPVDDKLTQLTLQPRTRAPLRSRAKTS